MNRKSVIYTESIKNAFEKHCDNFCFSDVKSEKNIISCCKYNPDNTFQPEKKQKRGNLFPQLHGGDHFSCRLSDY